MVRKFQDGVTLVELIVASSILLLLGLGANHLMTTLATVRREINLSGVQNSIAADTRKLLTSRQTFVQTIQAENNGYRKNPAFYSCACGVGTCRSLQTPFAQLFYHQSPTEMISPKFFTSEGHACDPALQACAFTLRTEFFAECAPDFASHKQDPSVDCNGKTAEFLAIRYIVEPSNSVVQATMGNIKTVSGWTFLDVNRMKLNPDDCL